MRRKEFLSKSVRGIIGMAAALPILHACKEDSVSPADEAEAGASSCTVTDAETDGPYPLHNSRGSATQRVDITDDKAGIPLNVTITVRNANDNCNVLRMHGSTFGIVIKTDTTLVIRTQATWAHKTIHRKYSAGGSSTMITVGRCISLPFTLVGTAEG